MRKLNILLVITKLELGGAQKQLLSLTEKLDRDKFSPFLFSASEGLLVSEVSNIKDAVFIKSRFLERPIRPLKDLLALFEIYRTIKRNSINIVHTHSSKAGIIARFAAKLAKAKVIIHTVHGWSFNEYQPLLLRKMYIVLERIAAAFSNKVIVVSTYDKEKGLKNKIGDPDKYVLIRYGINYSAFGATKTRSKEELKIGHDELVVGTISCLKPQKSPQDFVRVAAHVSKSRFKVKFVLVGDGILRPAVEKLIADFGLSEKVFLVGWQRDIPAILSIFDVFVLTSLWEGLPISVLEALACSKPVVATNTGGIAEIIRDGENGFLVERGNPQALGEKLILLLEDAALRKRIAQNARLSLSPLYETEEMIRETQNLYESAWLTQDR